MYEQERNDSAVQLAIKKLEFQKECQGDAYMYFLRALSQQNMLAIENFIKYGCTILTVQNCASKYENNKGFVFLNANIQFLGVRNLLSWRTTI